MPNFIPGIPAQNGPLNSAEIRENFLALNARTGKVTPRADNPPSSKVYLDGGKIYFNDNIVVDWDAQVLDLGDLTNGVSAFTNDGFFRDVAVVVRVEFNQTSSRYEAYPVFIEGPEKDSSSSQVELVNLRSTDLPVARFVVRHTGSDNVNKGQIEPITQLQISDFRNYLTVGGISYNSASTGDREVSVDAYDVVQVDGYGIPIITGSTVGTFTGSIRSTINDGYGGKSSPIQQAIDSVSALGGGSIFIKKGTYNVTKTIVVPDNISLYGEGESSIIQMVDSFPGPLLNVEGDNVFIQNLNIKAPDTLINVTKALVRFAGTNCTIENCKIKGGVVGLEFDSASRNICTKNYFQFNSVAIALGSSLKNIISFIQFENNITDISGSQGPHLVIGNMGS